MTSSQTGSAQTSLPTSIVVSVCALSGLVLAGAVTLLIVGRPLDGLMTIVAAIIAPTIAALLAAKKLGDIAPVLHDVSVKVNGRLDNALSTIAALEEQVRQTGGTPVSSPSVALVTPPAPRHSAENPPVASSDTSQEVTNNG